MKLYTHSNISELRYLLLTYSVRASHVPGTSLGFSDLSVNTGDKRSPLKRLMAYFSIPFIL